MPSQTDHSSKTESGEERVQAAEQQKMNTLQSDWRRVLNELGPKFAKRAAGYDNSDEFVSENYAEMREAKLFSALVPTELGGGGVSYSEVCSLIRGLGRCCGSTALAFSMHAHLLAAALWGYRHGRP